MRKPFIILEKGEKLSFQDMIEARVGQWLATQMPYNNNKEQKSIPGTGISYNDAYFDGDATYEIKIVKKHSTEKV